MQTKTSRDLIKHVPSNFALVKCAFCLTCFLFILLAAFVVAFSFIGSLLHQIEKRDGLEIKLRGKSKITVL